MGFDSEIVLLGTGVAPLVAASRFLAERKSVLIINPDWDFFREDSELPLDPMWPADETLNTERLAGSLRKKALAALRPDFPGAIELWPMDASGCDAEGYHDAKAPHVRTRSRLWIYPTRDKIRSKWTCLRETVEAMFVQASDAGLKPTVMGSVAAFRRFPGVSQKEMPPEDYEGVLLPKMSDVDVDRFRNGLLESILERIGPERVVRAASQIELTPDGVRFRIQGRPVTARVHEGVLVFWTPRLTNWILAQAKKAEVPVAGPRGVRLWEEWVLRSRDPLDVDTVGSFEDMTVWAQVEGAPTALPCHRLTVLKPGSIIPFGPNGMSAPIVNAGWASADSFGALGRLCHDFLCWEKFSVRAFRPRAVMEWNADVAPSFALFDARRSAPFRAHVIRGCDGPLVNVANAARAACARTMT